MGAHYVLAVEVECSSELSVVMLGILLLLLSLFIWRRPKYACTPTSNNVDFGAPLLTATRNKQVNKKICFADHLRTHQEVNAQ